MMNDNKTLDALKSLGELKKNGHITETEFEDQKKKLLEGQTARPLVSTDWANLSVKSKIALALLGIVITLASINGAISSVTHCDNWQETISQKGLVGLAKQECVGSVAQAASGNSTQQSEQAQAAQSAPVEATKENDDDLPKCDSEQAKDGLKNTVENGADQTVKLQLLDMDKLAEVSYDAQEKIRTCIAAVVLNTGNENIVYKFSHSKSDSGSFLIEINAVNDDSVWQSLQAQAIENAKTPEQKAQEATQASQQQQELNDKIQKLKSCYRSYRHIKPDQIAVCQKNFDSGVITATSESCQALAGCNMRVDNADFRAGLGSSDGCQHAMGCVDCEQSVLHACGYWKGDGSFNVGEDN